MAWVADPNFGSTHVASTAFAPFDTSPGNRVMGFGAGIAYRDDINTADVRISCDLIYTNHPTFAGGGDGNPVAYLVGRRKANGDFYAAGLSIYGNSNNGTTIVRIMTIKYDGLGDTITILGNTESGSILNSQLSNDFPPPLLGVLLKYDVAVTGTSIEGRLLDATGVVLLSVSSTNGDIVGIGNPGIGGNLINVEGPSNQDVPNMFADNLQIDSI